jgi:hypothetical protein
MREAAELVARRAGVDRVTSVEFEAAYRRDFQATSTGGIA